MTKDRCTPWVTDHKFEVVAGIFSVSDFGLQFSGSLSHGLNHPSPLGFVGSKKPADSHLRHLLCVFDGGFLVACIQRARETTNFKYEDVIEMVRNRLVGYELEPLTAALCIANMILRGDGKSGIRNMDVFVAPDYPVGKCNVVLMNLTIANNEVYGSVWTDHIAEVVTQGSNPVFINSIIWNDHLPSILNRSDFGNSTLTILHSDICGGKDNIAGGAEIDWFSGNMNDNPMFCDAAAQDYRLQIGSPCIDAGIQDTYLLSEDGIHAIYVPPISYLGNAPDMGACEHSQFTITGAEKSIEIIRYSPLIYPNPTLDIVNIELPISGQEVVVVELYDITGKEVYRNEYKHINEHFVEQIDLSGYAKGIYLVKVRQADTIYFGKVVVK